VASVIKHRYFTSIASIPGPFLASVGTCYQILQVFKGRSAEVISKLHEQNGLFDRSKKSDSGLMCD
jgi:hypothetical protein